MAKASAYSLHFQRIHYACFQIKLYLPADLEGSIALRSEEEAFWPSTGIFICRVRALKHTMLWSG